MESVRHEKKKFFGDFSRSEQKLGQFFGLGLDERFGNSFKNRKISVPTSDVSIVGGPGASVEKSRYANSKWHATIGSAPLPTPAR